MADDSDRNGHSTSPHYADVEDVESLERRLGQLVAEMRDMRQSLEMHRDASQRDRDLILDFLRTINKDVKDVLNNRDGYSVLKRLAAVEETLAKPKRVRAGRK